MTECDLQRRTARRVQRDIQAPLIRQISGNEFVFQLDSAQHTVLVRQLSAYVERRAGLYFTGTVATEQSRS